MTTSFVALRTWSMSRDNDGNREYKTTSLVKSDKTDGPAAVLLTGGLPHSGDAWNLGGESDPWAFCKLTCSIKQAPGYKDEPASYWEVENTFSSKTDEKKCKDQQIDDPLLQPPKISGGFQKYKEEANRDRFGKAILNSAFEMIRGPQVEFDANRITVKIEQNVAALQLPLLVGLMDRVNDAPMWGVPARCIKLSSCPWERKFYGQCSVYYTRTLEFEIRSEGFDRNIMDEGTKALKGHWDKVTGLWMLDPIVGYEGTPNPNPKVATHFDRFKDRKDENSRVILDGFGQPAGVPVGSGAAAHAVVDVFGNVTEIVMDSPGSGYSTPPLVTISPAGLDGFDATGVAVLDAPGGGVVSVTLTSGGADYRSDFPPTVTFKPNDSVGMINVQKYLGGNFFLLGVPTTF